MFLFRSVSGPTIACVSALSILDFRSVFFTVYLKRINSVFDNHQAVFKINEGCHGITFDKKNVLIIKKKKLIDMTSPWHYKSIIENWSWLWWNTVCITFSTLSIIMKLGLGLGHGVWQFQGVFYEVVARHDAAITLLHFPVGSIHTIKWV